MMIRDLDSLSFLYDREHFGWLERHRLNRACRKEIRAAMESGADIVVSCRKVAEELHRYYEVPYRRITVLHSQE